MTGAIVLRADALRLPLPDESVDLVCTSPPYWAQRDYRDGGESYDGQVGSESTSRAFLETLWDATTEWVRVLKPSGSIFVNLGDKYGGSGGHNNSSLSPPRTGEFGTRKHNDHAPRALAKEDADKSRGNALAKARASRRNAPDRYNQSADVRNKSLLGLPWLYALGCTGALAALGGPQPDLNLILRAEWIWHKPNGLPESVTDRVHRKHEQWFHLTREQDYYADLDPLREPHKWPANGAVFGGKKAIGAEGLAGSAERRYGHNTYDELNPAGAAPGSVAMVATVPLVVPNHLDVVHFAAFPPEWPRRLVLGWSPPDGVILDPFGGSGTTAMVARALGRRGVSVDLSADYGRLARWRIFESDGASKVRARTNAAAQDVLDFEVPA